MKKIRFGVFETNSSSVHTLTISNQSSIEEDKNNIYYENSINVNNFYYTGEPYNDGDTLHGGKYGDYSNGVVWEAKTTHEKAALFCLYLNDQDSVDIEISSYYISLLKQSMEYKDIRLRNDCFLSPVKDRGELDIDIGVFTSWRGSEHAEKMMIFNGFLDIIKDDSKMITVRKGEN
jgi:hypothetical protein